MGHLSISESKMLKSLKNLTTIREALSKGAWTARSLGIIFLLGGWREGIEITEDLTKAGSTWEDKLDNFFLKTQGSIASADFSPGTDGALADFLQKSQSSIHDALLDSFNHPRAMNAISELVSEYNNADKPTPNVHYLKATALWVTSMVNILGLNGTASPESYEIGWAGIAIAEPAKPYFYSLSTMRDSLRKAAGAKDGLLPDQLKDIVGPGIVAEAEPSDMAKPYDDVLF